MTNIIMKRNQIDILRGAYLLQLSEGCFTAGSLSLRTGMSYAHASRRIKSMKKSGLFREAFPKTIKGIPGRSGLRGFEPARYSLAEKGRRLIRVVLCGGVFDILHPGHLFFLREASFHGDLLVVVAAKDATVRKSKGRPPFLSQQDRLDILSSLKEVDLAVPGTGDYCQTLRKVSPDMVFLGHDQGADLRRVRACRAGARSPEIIVSGKRLESHSTSSIIRKIKAAGTK